MKIILILLIVISNNCLYKWFRRIYLEHSEIASGNTEKYNLEINRTAKDIAVNIMKYFIPKDVVGKKFVRVGGFFDGGYVMIDDFNDKNIAYSFGINDDVAWDLDMAKRNISVFMYDHTINALPVHNKHFHFFKTGVCGLRLCEDKQLKNLKDLLTVNEHLDNKHLILKMDVEDAEWDVILNTSVEIFNNFEQIVIEYHWLNNFEKNRVNYVISSLEKLNLTHEVIHFHVNNCRSSIIVGGFLFFPVVEVSYLRRDNNTFVRSEKYYPVEGYDTPNCHSLTDTNIGLWGHFDEIFA